MLTHTDILAVLLLMIPESACLPIPSEVTLLSAGFGVHQGWFSFPAAVAAATAGNLIGSSIAYWIGRSGVLARLPGGPGAAIERCERLFEKRGQAAVFIARLLPLARTFVSLPAGHARVPLRRFVPLTLAGCAIWCAAFVLAGDLAGAGWEAVAGVAGKIMLAVSGLLALALLAGGRPARRSA
ncbi:MAG TPA: DedA family protein [Thermoleophilaceae bacterium]|nr:DedA family protein [Thermoleophilaceae bacterium]